MFFSPPHIIRREIRIASLHCSSVFAVIDRTNGIRNIEFRATGREQACAIRKSYLSSSAPGSRFAVKELFNERAFFDVFRERSRLPMRCSFCGGFSSSRRFRSGIDFASALYAPAYGFNRLCGRCRDNVQLTFFERRAHRIPTFSAPTIDDLSGPKEVITVEVAALAYLRWYRVLCRQRGFRKLDYSVVGGEYRI